MQNLKYTLKNKKAGLIIKVFHTGKMKYEIHINDELYTTRSNLSEAFGKANHIYNYPETL